MDPNTFDLVAALGASGLAGVNVFLLFKIITLLHVMNVTQAAMLEHLRDHPPQAQSLGD